MARLVRWLDSTIFLGLVVSVLVTAPRGDSYSAGLAVVPVCTPCWVAARRQLGAAFSVGPAARHLVTSGLSAKSRHPVHVFGTPAVMGALVALLGWEALVIAVVPVEVLRPRREETVLAETFGSEYIACRERTWFSRLDRGLVRVVRVLRGERSLDEAT
jgi:protein-S-isoprenylcysteine O-methyltransferase Ste14